MKYIIGTDEAGYGPKLGPLVVSASCWETPTEDFSELGTELERIGLPVADSKKLYHSGGSLAALEAGTLVALQSFDFEPLPEPVAVDRQRLAELLEHWNRILKAHSVRFRNLSARIIHPTEFNRKLAESSSKGTLLSDVTLTLVLEMLKGIETLQKSPAQVLILCDKHGGRNRYLDLLNKYFPDIMIWTQREGREESVYRLAFSDIPTEIRFCVKGESHFPIALASMGSKYFRERAMMQFNAFWQEKIPGLKPTAGYPEDAIRFKKDIATVQAELNIRDDDLWRMA